MKKILLFIMPLLIFAATLNVSVNKKNIYPGEEVVYTIEASGNNVKFPDIKDIDGFPVQGTAITQNIVVLNGNMQKSVSKSYIFFPTKSVTIPSFNVIIDSKTYKTEPIKITVSKPKESKDENFKIKLAINKNTAYITEPILFKIYFYQKEGTNAQSIEIQKPNFENFFTKLVSKKEYTKNNYETTEYTFLLIPQKSGQYHIGPILAKIGYISKESPFNDPFFNLTTATIKYKNIFSNELNLSVKPIPSNTVFGKFTAELQANKTKTCANEPVKVTLKINGCGDFYDLPNFKLNIKDATVYENAPVIKTYLKNDSLCGTYTKEFTIISNHNFSIPQISFNEFDGNQTKKVTTNKIYINVINKHITKKEHKKEIIKNKIIYKTKNDYILMTLIFIIGVIVGILSTYLLKIRTNTDEDVIKKIKKANEKELFNILLEFSNHPEIEKILKELEENIYNNKNNKINKKEIIKIIKSIIKK